MKIVLTNDDGFEAPGLAALYEALAGRDELWVAAPALPQSGVGHSVTTRTPIAVCSTSPNRYCVSGTPADCVRLALKTLCPDADWVVAGINAGANLGSDVYQSGTVAAAREAALLGCRAIAVSQYIARSAAVDWSVTRRHAGRILRLLFEQELGAGQFWNVNLPHPLAADDRLAWKFCPLDLNPHQYRYREDAAGYRYEGTIHERPRDPGKDVAVCFGGEVSVTRLGLDCGACGR